MMFGAMGNPDHDDSIRIIHKALDACINLIDTADVYSCGESEEIVGEAIKGRRDDVVLATKFANPMGEAPNRQGASRRWIMKAVEDSLRRLQTDYIDLYQYHRPDPETDIEETLSALSDLVRKGQPSGLRRGGAYYAHLSNERRIDVVEQLIPLADEAGISLTHLAMAFAIAHPGVTAALLGPRTMEQLDDLLAGAGTVLSDDILDRIDAIVPPGADVGQLDMAYNPPAVVTPALRRRPVGERTAA
jgi:aryl-alcohol dehydrogenase-like predicted oxidoreductase